MLLQYYNLCCGMGILRFAQDDDVAWGLSRPFGACNDELTGLQWPNMYYAMLELIKYYGFSPGTDIE